MKVLAKFVLLLALLGANALSAQPRLTETVLNNLMSSAKELQALERTTGKELYEDEPSDDTSDSLNITPEKIITAVQRVGMYDDVASVVKKHGFGSVEEWAGVYSRTIKAMMATVMAGMADYQSQMQAHMNQMMANPDLTPEQKQAMMQMMQPAQMPTAPKADPQDIKDIEPFLEKLKMELVQDDPQ